MCCRMLSHNVSQRTACRAVNSFHSVESLLPSPGRAELPVCPCRVVLGLREPAAATARVGALRECTRDSVDFPLDSESPNYPRCTLYCPLLPHYCRKMYEKRLRYVVPLARAPRAARHQIISHLSSVRCRAFDLTGAAAAATRDSPG